MKIELYFGPAVGRLGDWQVLELPELRLRRRDLQDGGAPTTDGEPAPENERSGADEGTGRETTMTATRMR